MSTNAINQQIKPVFNLMKLTFGIVPIVAGLDKYTNLLTNWENYLHPAFKEMLPINAQVFMMIIGLIEIGAGIIVLLRPAMGGLIVAGWLVVIAISLLASGNYLDVAVRDLVMAVGAFSMVQISKSIR